ncbi:hypothetical protein [Neobacillus sp. FSL H8-0543]|uniref:hypothetical protein n=1 Tax=Neobacillus sp. FSL H8-0543 TaxID=2954672 RepID=UPI00315816EE
MTGFNRRFAPNYKSMKQVSDINMVILQKNRISLPSDARTFVYDDFIHCLDTVRFLIQDEIEDILVAGRKKDGLLYHVTVQLLTKDLTVIAIMNRDSGIVEERLEVMGPKEKE